MELPDRYIIHDIRTAKDLKGITIGGYKRGDVLKAYQNSMINNKLEDSIRWCVELHATGLNAQIWKSLQTIYFKYIHLNNPKLFFYIYKRQKDYEKAIRMYPKKHEIFTRNDQEIRNLYAELTAMISLARKNNIFLQKSLPTINNKSFEKAEIQKRMISKDIENINQYITSSTSTEMKLVYNEIYNNLKLSKGTVDNCIYWFLWLEKVENIKKKKSDIPILISEENWTFTIWQIIMNFEHKIDRKDAIYIRKLEHLYKKKFKINQLSMKKFYIFIAFVIIKSNINWNIMLYQQEYLIIQTNANINKMYGNIISSINSKISDESRVLLLKSYNQLKNSSTVIKKPKKIVKKHLDEDINKVIYTKFPQYKIINKNNFEENNDENKENIMKKEKLISKNMTIRDLMEAKEERKDKKISAFVQFTAYKENIKENIPVMDYFVEDEYKSIDIKNK